VLENLLSRQVSVLETAHIEDKVLIDSTTFTTCSVQAAAFQQAYVNFCDSGGETAKDIFVLKADVGPRRLNTQGGPPKKRGDGKDKDYAEWNGKIETFYATNPNHQEKVQWVLFDKCGENHQQHTKVESIQPFASDTWTCGVHHLVSTRTLRDHLLLVLFSILLIQLVSLAETK
jgi:hypothetical protein